VESPREVCRELDYFLRRIRGTLHAVLAWRAGWLYFVIIMSLNCFCVRKLKFGRLSGLHWVFQKYLTKYVFWEGKLRQERSDRFLFWGHSSYVLLSKHRESAGLLTEITELSYRVYNFKMGRDRHIWQKVVGFSDEKEKESLRERERERETTGILMLVLKFSRQPETWGSYWGKRWKTTTKCHQRIRTMCLNTWPVAMLIEQ
jgi:hypothetical protein